MWNITLLQVGGGWLHHDMDAAIFEPAAEIKRSWGGNGIGQRAELEKDKGPNYVAVSIIVSAITDLSGPSDHTMDISFNSGLWLNCSIQNKGFKMKILSQKDEI